MEIRKAIEILSHNSTKIQILSDFADKEYCAEALQTLISALQEEPKEEQYCECENPTITQVIGLTGNILRLSKNLLKHGIAS